MNNPCSCRLTSYPLTSPWQRQLSKPCYASDGESLHLVGGSTVQNLGETLGRETDSVRRIVGEGRLRTCGGFVPWSLRISSQKSGLPFEKSSFC